MSQFTHYASSQHHALDPGNTYWINYWCLVLFSRYAFTILSNVGVFVAMFLLLEFVSVGTYIPHTPSNSSILLSSKSSNASTLSPNDLWIFSVSHVTLNFVDRNWNIVLLLALLKPRVCNKREERVSNVPMLSIECVRKVTCLECCQWTTFSKCYSVTRKYTVIIGIPSMWLSTYIQRVV